MIKRRQEGLRKCQVKIDRNGRSENANACRYNYYAEEEGKDSEKEQNRKEMYLHTQVYFYVYLQEAEGSENGHRPSLTTVSGRGKCRWSVFFIFKRK